MPDSTIPLRDNDEIDLRGLLGTLIDHKRLIGIITALFLILSVAYVFLAAPIYQSSAVVQVERMAPSLTEERVLITSSEGGPSPQASTAISLILSRAVVGKAVEDLKLDLMETARRLPLIGNGIARRFASAHPGEVAAPALGMNSFDWGGSQLEISRLQVPDELLGKKLQLIAGTDGSYTLDDDDGNLLLQGTVGQTAQGHGVTLQVTTLRANPGTRFQVVHANTLSVVGNLQQDINVTEEGKDSGVLLLTYNNADPALANAVLDQVTRQFVRQNADRNATEASKSLEFVRAQLPNVRLDLEKATAALNAFQNQAHSVNLDMQTSDLLTQVAAVDTSIQQLRLQQTDLARHYTPQHPAYRAVSQQIAEQEAHKGDLEKQISHLPDVQQQLLRLTSNVEVSNKTYESLLQQAQQLEIARAGTMGNARIIDAAAVDVTQPIWPKKILVVLGATFAGAFLTIVFVYLRQMLDRGIEEPSVIEQAGLPVYASIPLTAAERNLSARDRRTRADGRQHLLALAAPADPAIETLRGLRTSLQFARSEAKNNLLMISGISQASGKTFVCANLAVVTAQTGQRVLLIDGDLRKGTLHKLMGGRAEPGLSELISGQTDLATALRPVSGVGHLHFLARGKLPSNPSELLMSARFGALLQQLMPNYDLVIIDTAPILAVTDAAVIGNHAGTSLLVVRFGLNQARDVTLATQRFAQNGVEIRGAILNAVEKRSGSVHADALYQYRPGR
jgi:tyrosine-protein kinase Etk/Wzc